MRPRFIFGGNTGMSYEELQRLREQADYLRPSGVPQTIGGGIAQLGQGIGAFLADRRANRAAAAGTERANQAFSSIFGSAPLSGSPTPPDPAPVVPGVVENAQPVQGLSQGQANALVQGSNERIRGSTAFSGNAPTNFVTADVARPGDSVGAAEDAVLQERLNAAPQRPRAAFAPPPTPNPIDPVDRATLEPGTEISFGGGPNIQAFAPQRPLGTGQAAIDEAISGTGGTFERQEAPQLNVDGLTLAFARNTARFETGTDDLLQGSLQIANDTGGSKSYGVLGVNSGFGRGAGGGSAGVFAKAFPGLGLTARPGSAAFDQQWRRAAQEQPQELVQAQLQYLQNDVIGPAVSALRNAGAGQFADDPRVVNFVSDAVVQYGPSLVNKHFRAGAQGRTAEDFINRSADSMRQSLRGDFRTYLSSRPQNFQGLVNRVEKRRNSSLQFGAPDEIAGGAGNENLAGQAGQDRLQDIGQQSRDLLNLLPQTPPRAQPRRAFDPPRQQQQTDPFANVSVQQLIELSGNQFLSPEQRAIANYALEQKIRQSDPATQARLKNLQLQNQRLERDLSAPDTRKLETVYDDQGRPVKAFVNPDGSFEPVGGAKAPNGTSLEVGPDGTVRFSQGAGAGQNAVTNLDRLGKVNSQEDAKALSRAREQALATDEVVGLLNAAEAILDNGYQTGALSTIEGTADSFGASVGLTEGNTAAQFEQLQSISKDLGIKGLQALGGNDTERELITAIQTTVSPNKTLEANRAILARQRKVFEIVATRPDFMASWLRTYGSLANPNQQGLNFGAAWRAYQRQEWEKFTNPNSGGVGGDQADPLGIR